MASIRPSSSLSPSLRRQSSRLSSHIRSVSTCSCSLRGNSLLHLSQNQKPNPQFPWLHQTWASSIPSSYQTRSFVTKLSRKTADTKPRARGAPSTRSSPTETGPLPLTNLPYFIRRTPSNQFPVYLETKAGGTRQLTKVQKTEGDLEALRNDLLQALGMEESPGDIQVNPLSGHVVVKGWRKPEILQFLSERKF